MAHYGSLWVIMALLTPNQEPFIKRTREGGGEREGARLKEVSDLSAHPVADCEEYSKAVVLMQAVTL